MAFHSVSEMLEQSLLFLNEMNTFHYTQTCPQAYGASIGAHYRHVIDHVEILINGIDKGLIDYDNRQRDKTTETDLSAAIEKTSTILKRWNQITPEQLDTPLQVISKVSYKREESAQVTSSLGREAMYSTIHAVHHFALIGVMCELLEIPISQGFGIAPSTLAHQQKEACAS